MSVKYSIIYADQVTDVIVSDKDRHQKLMESIDFQKRRTKRQSVMQAVEIKHVLKIKLREFDCFGTHLWNLKFGVEIVHVLENMNDNYSIFEPMAFIRFAKDEIKKLINAKKIIEADMIEAKRHIDDVPEGETRINWINEIHEAMTLVTTRYNSFLGYFNRVHRKYRDIGAIVSVSDDLKDIREAVRNALKTLNEKEDKINSIPYGELKEFFYEDINDSIDKLNCQLQNILAYMNANVRRARESIGFDFIDDDKVEEQEEKQDEELEEEHDEYIFEPVLIETISDSSGYTSEEDSKAEEVNCCVSHISKTVAPAVISGLVQVALKSPQDPNCFMFNYLEHYAAAEEKMKQKRDFMSELLAERAVRQERKAMADLLLSDSSARSSTSTNTT